MYRRLLLAREVRHYTTKIFPRKGVFVECGSGTGESSLRIRKFGRVLIALDISVPPLNVAREAGVYDHYIRGDIFNLPFPDDSMEPRRHGALRRSRDNRNPQRVQEGPKEQPSLHIVLAVEARASTPHH